MWKVELNRKKATGIFIDAQGLTAFHYVAAPTRTMMAGQAAWEREAKRERERKKK